MTTVDVYAAWLTAGDTLRPYGAWLAANWVWLAAGLLILGAVAVVRWAVRDDYRTYNDKRAAWFVVCDGPRPEPAAPGEDDQLLDACRQILHATDTAAKGDQQP